MAGANRGKIERKEEEFLVKWQLPGTLDVATAKRQINTLLGELMASFEDVPLLTIRNVSGGSTRTTTTSHS
jgi:hypothetical protein